HAAAMVGPRVHAARIQRKRDGRSERPGRVLAPEVIADRMSRLDRAGGHRIGNLKGGNELSGGKDLKLKVAAGHVRDISRQRQGTAVNVLGPAFREGRSQTPGDLRIGLRDSRCGQRAGSSYRAGTRCTGLAYERTAIHKTPPFPNKT